MSLRIKTVLIIVATFVVLLLFLVRFSQTVILESYARLEDDAARKMALQAHNVLETRLNNYWVMANDWAIWDESYAFVNSLDDTYIEINLIDDTFTKFQLNFMIFLDADGEVVYSQGYDLRANQKETVRTSMAAALASSISLLSLSTPEDATSGIIMVDDLPVALGVAPILPSAGIGDVRGALLVGRYLDEATMKRMSQEVGIPMTLLAWDQIEWPPEQVVMTRVLNEQQLAAYTRIEGIQGEPGALLRVGMQRDIYEQGTRMLSYFTIVLVALGVALCAVILLSLEKVVLARLAELGECLVGIGVSNDLSSRVPVRGRDELGSLANNINGMLNSLERYQAEVVQQAQLQERVKEVTASKAERDRFYTNASREFRTPLANLRTYHYLARRRPDRLNEYLNVLEQVTSDMTEIMEDLFDAARFGQENLKVSLQWANIRDILVSILGHQAARTGQKLVNHLTDDRIIMQVNVSALRKAIDRVLDYALKNTPENGTVQVHLERLNNSVMLLISSDILTSKLDQIDQLFDPFAVTSENDSQMTRLGLTVAKEIIIVHGGTIRFEPEQAGGTFLINLPLVNESTPQPVQALPQKSPN
jgi:sensor domain CHASE-containing protein